MVADNGSTDGSVEWIKEHHPEVMLIEYRKNLGFAEGYNRAIEILDYPYSLLLNSDVEVTEGWWQPLFRFMEENPEVGALQPKIKSYRDKSRFEYAGAAGGFLDRLGYPYCRGRLFDCVEKDEGQYDGEVKDVVWASGAALLVRTDMFRRAGRLDPHFFAHMEEIDLCWRILLDGHQIMAVPQSRVYHLGGGSLPAANPRKTYLNFRNNLLLLHKNLPLRDLRPTLLRRRLLDTIAWMKFMLTMDFANANAILRAHRDFRRMRRNYTSHPAANLLRDTPSCRRNILLDYYLRRRRHFSRL